MPRYAQAVGEDGQDYLGEIVRKPGGAWAIFHEPPSKQFPKGPYVLHRWMPYMLAWMPVTSHATEEEARARLEALLG